MSSKAVTGHSEILVSGKDMFGAAFRERTQLLNLWEDKFSFALFRPVSDNLLLRVNFHPDDVLGEFWVEGLVQDVKSRLDGKQTVELRLIR
jgi:hypothetical protein